MNSILRFVHFFIKILLSSLFSIITVQLLHIQFFLWFLKFMLFYQGDFFNIFISFLTVFPTESHSHICRHSWWMYQLFFQNIYLFFSSLLDLNFQSSFKISTIPIPDSKNSDLIWLSIIIYFYFQQTKKLLSILSFYLCQNIVIFVESTNCVT